MRHVGGDGVSGGVMGVRRGGDGIREVCIGVRGGDGIRGGVMGLEGE